jgi:hypothetical protein
MNAPKIPCTMAAALLFALAVFTGCETTDGGGTQVTNNYYGVAYSDPWYHGDYHGDPDVIVIPPPSGNPPDPGLRPTHPIASPPQVSKPSPRPPQIPSTPRPAPRAGGRR